MAHRNYRPESPIAGLIALYIIYMGSLWFINKILFFKLLIINEFVLLFICLGILAFWEIKEWLKRKTEKIINNVINYGIDEVVNNFINRFGSDKNKKAWKYRGYSFDWYRMREFLKQLQESGVPIPPDLKILISILKYFINIKEERVTRESVKVLQHKYSDLSGSGFENLLAKLYEAQGYAVQKIGRTGDQGGDLIANKSPERILIQAKCYNGSLVGNAGVQDAVAAKGYYDCNKGIVITSSDFTKDAIDLAKKFNIELIEKRRLSELLLLNLNESWN